MLKINQEDENSIWICTDEDDRFGNLNMAPGEVKGAELGRKISVMAAASIGERC